MPPPRRRRGVGPVGPAPPSQQEEAPSLLKRLLAGGVRVGSGIAASPFAMVPGVGSATAAGIGAAGELGAELIEGSDPSWKRAAVEGGLAAVPLGAVIKGGKAIQSALRSGAMSGAGEFARQKARGEETDWKGTGLAALLGGVTGGVLGKFTPEYKPTVKPGVHRGTEVHKLLKDMSPKDAERLAKQHEVSQEYDIANRIRKNYSQTGKATDATLNKVIQTQARTEKEARKAAERARNMALRDKASANKAQAQADTLLGKEAKAAQDAADKAAAKVKFDETRAGMKPGKPSLTESFSTKLPGGGTGRVSTRFKAPKREDGQGNLLDDADDLGDDAGDLGGVGTSGGGNKPSGGGGGSTGSPVNPSRAAAHQALLDAGHDPNDVNKLSDLWAAYDTTSDDVEKRGLGAAISALRKRMGAPKNAATSTTGPAAAGSGVTTMEDTAAEVALSQELVAAGVAPEALGDALKLHRAGVPIANIKAALKLDKGALKASADTDPPLPGKGKGKGTTKKGTAGRSFFDKLLGLEEEPLTGQPLSKKTEELLSADRGPETMPGPVRPNTAGKGQSILKPKAGAKGGPGLKPTQRQEPPEPPPAPTGPNPGLGKGTGGPRLNKNKGPRGGGTVSALGGLGWEDIKNLVAAHPEFAKRLGMAAGGAVLGGVTDPFDNPAVSALAGAGVGYAARPAMEGLQGAGKIITKGGYGDEVPLMSGQGAKEVIQRGARLAPHAQRFNYLMDAWGLPANVGIGPWGSTLTGGLTKWLSGDQRGKAAVMGAANPFKFFGKDRVLAARSAAEDLVRQGESGRGEITDFPDWVGDRTRDWLTGPAQALTTGDQLALRTLLDAGFGEDEARRMIMTGDARLPFFKWIQHSGQNSSLRQFLQPFRRTPANIGEQGALATPGLGAYLQSELEDPDPMREQLVKQGLGALFGVGGYVAGDNMDPETARILRRYVTNASGQYGLLSGLGFTAGQAHRKGQSVLSPSTLRSLDQAMPLPTLDPIADKIVDLSQGEIPRGVIPSIAHDVMYPAENVAPARRTLAQRLSAARRRNR